ncbi:ComF family protein [Pedobacter immunditicola]|uniref:ComF family protein n=1 Tax=Pedobacter immunditicola TaxID=3133440 RepID=UPI0030ACB5C0
MRSTIQNLFKDFTNLLYPELCPACDARLNNSEKDICIKCEFDLPYTDFHLHRENPVAKQFWGRIPLHTAMALLYFTKESKTQNLMHQLKYKSQPQIGFLLGEMIGERLIASGFQQNYDYIVPVPIHEKRLRSRGYNQSEYIANGIAEKLKIPVKTKVIIRYKQTKSQTKNERFERFHNLENAFMVLQPMAVTGQHILLVDDVITTGATLEACATTLGQHKPAHLSIAAAAYAK